MTRASGSFVFAAHQVRHIPIQPFSHQKTPKTVMTSVKEIAITFAIVIVAVVVGTLLVGIVKKKMESAKEDGDTATLTISKAA